MSTIGTIELIAKIDTSQYKRGAAEVDRANKDMESSSEKSASNSSTSFTKVAKIGLAAVAAAAVAVGAIIIRNFDNAIKRVDTLNNSARTFENMGFSANTVQRSMSALEKSIRGLPTPLDEAVRGVTMISASINDLPKSQKLFTSLNNAIIGFGGTTADVTNAVLQMSQAFAGGRIDAQTWNSMLNSGLGPALAAIARTMGITGKQLKDGLGDGTISVEKFQDALISMNEKGGGGMKSFQEISKDATKGIGTGWQNLETAVTRGIASIIEAIGTENISSAITDIGAGFESALKSVVTFGEMVGELWNNIQPFVSGVVNAFLPSLQALWETFEQRLLPSLERAKGFFQILGIALTVLAAVPFAVFIAVVWASINVINILMNVFGFLIQVASNVVSWFASVWSTLYPYISAPFINAFNTITGIFRTLYAFFTGIWGSIIGLFTSVGTKVGDAFGNAFKSVMNSVLSFVVSKINAFIAAINGVIDIIQRIPGVGGRIGNIGSLSVPHLATGGIITSPTLAMVGEGREAEAVIPLSKLDGLVNSKESTGQTIINIEEINMSGIMTRSKSDEREIAVSLVQRVNEILVSKGQPELGGGAL